MLRLCTREMSSKTHAHTHSNSTSEEFTATYFVCPSPPSLRDISALLPHLLLQPLLHFSPRGTISLSFCFSLLLLLLHRLGVCSRPSLLQGRSFASQEESERRVPGDARIRVTGDPPSRRRVGHAPTNADTTNVPSTPPLDSSHSDTTHTDTHRGLISPRTRLCLHHDAQKVIKYPEYRDHMALIVNQLNLYTAFLLQTVICSCI